MDRLARNLDDLRRLVRTLTGKGVRMEFVTENLAFTGENSPMATLLLSVMGAFAEFERALILERQREGIAAAKQRGVYTGRRPALTAEQAHRCASGPRPASGSRRWPASSASAARPCTAICGPRSARDEGALPPGPARTEQARAVVRGPAPPGGNVRRVGQAACRSADAGLFFHPDVQTDGDCLEASVRRRGVGGEVQLHARVLGQPGLDVRVLVGGVVVTHDVQSHTTCSSRRG